MTRQGPGLEALAAAERLSATICLASIDQNPQLISAAALRAVPVRLVEGRLRA